MTLRNTLSAALALLLSWVPLKADVVFMADSGQGGIIFRDLFGVDFPGLGEIEALAVGPNRILYATVPSTGEVKMITSGGEVSPLASALGTTGGLAIGPDGFVYVALVPSKTVVKLGTGGTPPVFATLPQAVNPASMVFDRNGVLYVADADANKVFKVSAEGAVSVLSDDVTTPRAVAVDENGAVLVADLQSGGRVARFIGNGKTKNVAINLGDLRGLTVTSEGDIYVSDGAQNQVKQVIPPNGIGNRFLGFKAVRQIVSAPRGQKRVIAFNGTPVSEPEGAQIESFGAPVTTADGSTAFTVKLRNGVASVGAKNAAAIYRFKEAETNLIARESAAAPGTDSFFKGFSDPVMNDDGKVAFRATLAGGTAKASNASGIWSDILGPVGLVARQGAEAPETDGAKFVSFSQVVMTGYGGGPLFVAKVSGGDADSTNNLGIWRQTATGGIQLVLRTGEEVSVNNTLRKLTAFKLLGPVPFAAGQSRSFNRSGEVAYLGTFTGGVKAVCQASNKVSRAIRAVGQNAAAPAEAVYSAFGIPTIGGRGEIAFRGTLKPGIGGVIPSSSSGIWLADAEGKETLVSRASFKAPGTTDAVFQGFSDPVNQPYMLLAFRATLKPGVGDATSSNALGLWAELGGPLDCFARKGNPAAGIKSASYTNFTSFVISLRDLVYSATIAGEGVTHANNSGLWVASDFHKRTDLLLRKGEKLKVNNVEKTIASITVNKALPVVSGQGRSVASDGSTIAFVKFTDRSSALVRIELL